MISPIESADLKEVAMTKSPKEAAAAAEEIRVLQEQMKEMQRRLDALCAEQPADVEDVENDESSSQDAEPVSGSVRAQPCSDQAEPWQDDAADACAPSEADGSDSDKAANGEGASHVSSEERPVNSPSVEPVSAPGETYAASCVSSQNAYCASEQTAYQPPVNPVSGYTAQQTQPFVSGAPVPPPSYDAAAQQAAQQQQAYYGHPTGQQAYQSGGASYSSSYGSSAQTPYNPYGQTVYQQPVVRTKDHVAAGLLGIFLGSLGVHKFYLGYNTAGFIMLGVAILGGLLSFGIATSIVWLIGLIEGIIYLVKNQAEFEQAYVFSKREWF